MWDSGIANTRPNAYCPAFYIEFLSTQDISSKEIVLLLNIYMHAIIVLYIPLGILRIQSLIHFIRQREDKVTHHTTPSLKELVILKVDPLGKQK